MVIISFIITALVFLLILSVLVLIHEAGHYFVAKKLGIKVEEFGFGFPLTPPLWQIKRGETLYSFYPVLIGGFVKLYGEDEAGGGRIDTAKNKELKAKNDKDDKRAFFSRSLGQRTAVIVAGVVMNALLAAFIYYIFLGISGFKTELPLIGDHQFFAVTQTVKTQVVVSEISKGSPAEQAGIKPFSTVMTLNGATVSDLQSFSQQVKASAGKPLTITWKEDKSGKSMTATVTPRMNPPKGEGALGVGFFPVQTVILSYDTPVQKVFSGFIHPANLMVYNFDVLGKLIGVSVKEKNVEPLSQGVSGPVGIYSVVGQIIDLPNIKERFLQILNLAGLLSISLAFFNVLPIPGLDGGRLFFILLEAVIGRKINPKIEGYFHAVGMIILIALLLLVTIKDVTQLFK
jgi:regulator of sigma E protease